MKPLSKALAPFVVLALVQPADGVGACPSNETVGLLQLRTEPQDAASQEGSAIVLEASRVGAGHMPTFHIFEDFEGEYPNSNMTRIGRYREFNLGETSDVGGGAEGTLKYLEDEQDSATTWLVWPNGITIEVGTTFQAYLRFTSVSSWVYFAFDVPPDGNMRVLRILEQPQVAEGPRDVRMTEHNIQTFFPFALSDSRTLAVSQSGDYRFQWLKFQVTVKEPGVAFARLFDNTSTPVVTGTHTFTNNLGSGQQLAFELLFGAQIDQLATCQENRYPDGLTAKAISSSTTCGARVDYKMPVSCTEDVNYTCSPSSGSFFEAGTTQVLCWANHTFGNLTHSFNLTLEVVDDTPPVLVNLTDIAVDTCGDVAQVSHAVAAIDNCQADVEAMCNFPSGSWFGVGNTTVECRATDAAGNSASGSFVVTVTGDETAPSLSQLPDIRKTIRERTATVTFDVEAYDNCTGGVVAVCAPASGGQFEVGSTLVECTATDTAGNTGSMNFTVNLTGGSNSTPPPIGDLPDINVTAAGCADGAQVTFADVAPGVYCSPPSGSWLPLGSTTVHCSVTDGFGNSNTSSFQVLVTPNASAPPRFGPTPDIEVVAYGTTFLKQVDFQVSATGPCEVVSTTCVPPPGSLFPIGKTKVTCSAKDSAGNVARTDFRVVVHYHFYHRRTRRHR